MANTKLGSADHKKIITDLMQSLVEKFEKSWIIMFYKDQEDLDPDGETMIDLASYPNQMCWKRTKKWKHDDNVMRRFDHVSGLGHVTIAEIVNEDGSISLEIEMENMPEPYRKAMLRTETFNVPSLDGPVGKKMVDKQPKQ